VTLPANSTSRPRELQSSEAFTEIPRWRACTCQMQNKTRKALVSSREVSCLNHCVVADMAHNITVKSTKIDKNPVISQGLTISYSIL
jgi:hypothetical protein